MAVGGRGVGRGWWEEHRGWEPGEEGERESAHPSPSKCNRNHRGGYFQGMAIFI